MAYRRGLAAVGAGLAGFGRNFGDGIMQWALEKERREAEAAERERIAKMQADAAAAKEDQDSQNRIIEEALKTLPITARKRAGIVPDQRDIGASVLDDIAKADAPEKLLTETEFTQNFINRGGEAPTNYTPATGPFSDLLRARSSREQLLTRTAAEKAAPAARASMQRVRETAPDGSQSERFVDPTDTNARYRVSLSGGEQGAVDRAKELAGPLHPQITAAKGAQQAGIERATRPGEVARAGAIAGAQERARAEVQYDPKMVQARIDEMKQRGAVEAANALSRENALEAQKAAAAATTANMALSQIKPLWDKVKLGGGLVDSVKRTGRYVGTQTGMLQSPVVGNPEAAMLDKQTQMFSMLLYKALGGTASQTSDRDLTFLQAGLPFSWNIDKVGDKVFKNASIMLTYAPMIRGRYGLLPFEQQATIVNEWMQMNERAAAAGVDEFQDPRDPSKTVPVIK